MMNGCLLLLAISGPPRRGIGKLTRSLVLSVRVDRSSSELCRRPWRPFQADAVERERKGSSICV